MEQDFDGKVFDQLFKRLDVELMESIDSQYFQEPREFRSLIEVLGVLNERVDQMNKHKEIGSDMYDVLKSENPAHSRLLHQLRTVKKIIEDIVSFQHGGLNNSLDTMSEVIKEYNKSRDEIQTLRKSLAETQTVLTAKKSGQISLKELWSKKVEMKESLRMVRELEELKNIPLKVSRLIQQKRYLTSSNLILNSLAQLFGEDFVAVGGLVNIREQTLSIKEKLLEACVEELKEAILEVALDVNNSSDSDEEETSESSPAVHQGNDQHEDSYSVNSLSFKASQLGNQSFKLDDVDETLEIGLSEPKTNDPIFLRLIVRAVSNLQYQDDAERLLTEIIPAGFQQTVIPKLKSITTNPSTLISPADKSKDEANFNEKCFHKYSKLLHSTLFNIVQRIIYVWKLLAVSKYNTSFDPTDTFPKDIQARLLRSVLSIFQTIEDIVLKELKAHLIEMDVENISDRKSLHQQLHRGDEDDEESKSRKLQPFLKPSVWYASGVYERSFHFNGSIGKLLGDSFSADVLKTASNSFNSSLNSRGIAFPVYTNLMVMINRLVEEEFIPVVQSWVNQESRESQIEWLYADISNLVSVRSQLPSFAIKRELNTVNSLFRLWIQLFQHREYLTVIAERLLRSLVFNLKEFIGNTARLVAANSVLEGTKFADFLSKDFLYIQHYKPFLSLKSQLEDGKAKMNSNSLASAGLDSLHQLHIDECRCLLKPMLESQEHTDKVFESKYMTALSILLSDCDWFAKKLLSCSILAITKGQRSQSSLGQDAALRKLSSVKELPNSVVPFATMITANIADLQHLSMECLSHFKKAVWSMWCQALHAIFHSIHSNKQAIDESVISSYFTQLSQFLENLVSLTSPLQLMSCVGQLSVAVPRGVFYLFLLQKTRNLLPADKMKFNQLKTIYLKVLVTLQQQLSIIWQSYLQAEPDIARKIADITVEEFERARKFFSVIDSSPSDLQAYFQVHRRDFADEEMQLIKVCLGI